MTETECTAIVQSFRSRIKSPVVGFQFRNYKNCLGRCYYRGTFYALTMTITLNRYFAEHGSRADVLETLLHEIAHAIAGPGLGHGAEWQAIAREIGCKDVAGTCNSEHANKIMQEMDAATASYVAVCCQRHYMHRATTRKYKCKKCKAILIYSPVKRSDAWFS